jgi:hypothetical protein
MQDARYLSGTLPANGAHGEGQKDKLFKGQMS